MTIYKPGTQISLPVSTEVVSLPSAAQLALYATVQVKTSVLGSNSPIRFTIDGSTPVASGHGFIANENDVIELWGSDELIGFRAIADSSVIAILEIAPMGKGGV